MKENKSHLINDTKAGKSSAFRFLPAACCLYQRGIHA
jgi:hypothetical protein